MEYDVLIVGGGVAGLSTAIKIKQLSTQYERPLSVCLIEKGQEIGDHILSGNCFETKAFDELFPKWRSLDQ
jgi:electron-transferring-flavoprotein dehydrogenase